MSFSKEQYLPVMYGHSENFVRCLGHNYYSDFGKERSGVKGSLSCRARKFLEGIASWSHWLLGRLPWRKHEKLSCTHRMWLVNIWSKILSTYMAKAPLQGFLLPLFSMYHLHPCLRKASSLWRDKSPRQKEGLLFQVWLPPGTNWDHFQCCRGQYGLYKADQDRWDESVIKKKFKRIQILITNYTVVFSHPSYTGHAS